MNKETISQLNKVLEQYDYYTQNLSLAELKSIVDISSDQIDLEAIDSKVKILHKTQFSSEISELFFAKCKKSCWREIDEGCYDSVFWPRSKSDIDIIHANFNIPLNEVVLYMRDTSFWNNKNQRKCVKLGISLERAEEIIQMCTPSLSTEEQEYLDTLHELTENPQDISPKLRKILDREAEVLGILEQRKIELEKL